MVKVELGLSDFFPLGFLTRIAAGCIDIDEHEDDARRQASFGAGSQVGIVTHREGAHVSNHFVLLSSSPGANTETSEPT